MSLKKLERKDIPFITNPFGSYDPTTKEHTPTKVYAPLYVRDDGTIIGNGDSADAIHFFDYYGEMQHGCTWISEDLENWAKKTYGKNAYWEWESAGEICLVKN